MDTAGILDRLAARRYQEDPAAAPNWWTPYPLPPELTALQPVPDTHFLLSDRDSGRRLKGGLFSLDGIHPTTVGYGILAQEMIKVMCRAGVEFRTPRGEIRRDPVGVDFDRLIRRDTLINQTPRLASQTLQALGWADETIDLVRRCFPF